MDALLKNLDLSDEDVDILHKLKMLSDVLDKSISNKEWGTVERTWNQIKEVADV